MNSPEPPQREIGSGWVEEIQKPSHAPGKRNRFPRYLLCTVVASAGLYLVVTIAFFSFMRFQRGLHELEWTQIVLPTGWKHLRTAVGNQQITVAQTLAREGRGMEALSYAHAGVTRVPDHREGRLLLSRLLTATGQPEAAQEALLAGLAYEQRDPRYLEELFGLLLNRQENERAVAAARGLLGEKLLPLEVRQLALLAGATASYLQGNFDQADDFLRSTPTAPASVQARLLSAKINWERGYRELALVELRSLAAAFPHTWEIHADLVSRLRQSNLSGEARRAALAFQVAHPDLPGPRIALLHAYREDGDIAQLQREIDSLIQDFAADRGVILRVAEFAAAMGDVSLARRLLDHARVRNLPWEPHAFLFVEALVVAREYQNASNTIRTLLREYPDWAQRHGPLLHSLQAATCLGLGDYESARLFLTHVLHQPALRADSLLAMSNRFAELGAAKQAHEILIRAFAADRRNQVVLTRLVEFDLNLNRIDHLLDHLGTLLTMRRPSPDILRVARHKLGSDLFLFSPGRTAVLDAVHVALERNRRETPRL